jgi:hypothetical protein
MTWRRENSWPYRDSNSDPLVVQLVASCYTDYAVWLITTNGFVRNVAKLKYVGMTKD